jgi:hypothetical protein
VQTRSMAEQITREIPRAEWHAYFDDFSRDLPVLIAMLEVDGAEIGSQIEADTSRLTAITYDYKDDVVVIGLEAASATENVEHLVSKPQRISELQTDGETVFDFEDGEGTKTLLRLRAAPELG